MINGPFEPDDKVVPLEARHVDLFFQLYIKQVLVLSDHFPALFITLAQNFVAKLDHVQVV